MSGFFFFFFSPIFWGRWTGSVHRKQRLAKFGYKSEGKEEIYIPSSAKFWRRATTDGLNLGN